MAEYPTRTAAVRQSLIALVVTLVIMGVILLVPAGTLNWPRGWWFCAAFVVATLLAIAPVLLVFLFAQRYLVSGMTAGGTKE